MHSVNQIEVPEFTREIQFLLLILSSISLFAIQQFLLGRRMRLTYAWQYVLSAVLLSLIESHPEIENWLPLPLYINSFPVLSVPSSGLNPKALVKTAVDKYGERV